MSRISSRAAAAVLAGALAGVGGIGLAAAQAAAKPGHRTGRHAAAHHRRHAASRSHGRAAGSTTNAQSAVGDFFSGPFHFVFSAQRAAGAAQTAATGSLTATLDLGGTALTMVTGPVTCLDVVGNRAGLFYPISSANPSVLRVLTGVLLYLQLGSNGQPQSINYIPLVHSVSSCTPLPGLLPITSGTLTLTS